MPFCEQGVASCVTRTRTRYFGVTVDVPSIKVGFELEVKEEKKRSSSF